jgi:hypothetical protein
VSGGKKHGHNVVSTSNAAAAGGGGKQPPHPDEISDAIAPRINKEGKMTTKFSSMLSAAATERNNSRTPSNKVNDEEGGGGGVPIPIPVTVTVTVTDHAYDLSMLRRKRCYTACVTRRRFDQYTVLREAVIYAVADAWRELRGRDIGTLKGASESVLSELFSEDVPLLLAPLLYSKRHTKTAAIKSIQKNISASISTVASIPTTTSFSTSTFSPTKTKESFFPASGYKVGTVSNEPTDDKDGRSDVESDSSIDKKDVSDDELFPSAVPVPNEVEVEDEVEAEVRNQPAPMKKRRKVEPADASSPADFLLASATSTPHSGSAITMAVVATAAAAADGSKGSVDGVGNEEEEQASPLLPSVVMSKSSAVPVDAPVATDVVSSGNGDGNIDHDCEGSRGGSDDEGEGESEGEDSTEQLASSFPATPLLHPLPTATATAATTGGGAIPATDVNVADKRSSSRTSTSTSTSVSTSESAIILNREEELERRHKQAEGSFDLHWKRNRENDDISPKEEVVLAAGSKKTSSAASSFEVPTIVFAAAAALRPAENLNPSALANKRNWPITPTTGTNTSVNAPADADADADDAANSSATVDADANANGDANAMSTNGNSSTVSTKTMTKTTTTTKTLTGVDRAQHHLLQPGASGVTSNHLSVSLSSSPTSGTAPTATGTATTATATSATATTATATTATATTATATSSAAAVHQCPHNGRITLVDIADTCWATIENVRQAVERASTGKSGRRLMDAANILLDSTSIRELGINGLLTEVIQDIFQEVRNLY